MSCYIKSNSKTAILGYYQHACSSTSCFNTCGNERMEEEPVKSRQMIEEELKQTNGMKLIL